MKSSPSSVLLHASDDRGIERLGDGLDGKSFKFQALSFMQEIISRELKTLGNLKKNAPGTQATNDRRLGEYNVLWFKKNWNPCHNAFILWTKL
ncbi:MAG: hypothetical protein WCS96_01800 [Victivallales bacterium]